ncbi:hypothetical protein E2C01_063877 [Portunus trituberculatus]|uniref:Uncharacterized protein n=1 Tax=Portunus trituberculatus TaxID=210409 RepID=A0A5B7HK80_PORTR|nr:hypothetical protein [Portunus trituberculatus]
MHCSFAQVVRFPKWSVHLLCSATGYSKNVDKGTPASCSQEPKRQRRTERLPICGSSSGRAHISAYLSTASTISVFPRTFVNLRLSLVILAGYETSTVSQAVTQNQEKVHLRPLGSELGQIHGIHSSNSIEFIVPAAPPDEEERRGVGTLGYIEHLKEKVNETVRLSSKESSWELAPLALST